MFDIPFSNDRNPPGENPPEIGRNTGKTSVFLHFYFFIHLRSYYLIYIVNTLTINNDL